MPKDIQLVKTIISIWDPTCWLAKRIESKTAVDWSIVSRQMPPKIKPPSISGKQRSATHMKKAAKKKVKG